MKRFWVLAGLVAMSVGVAGCGGSSKTAPAFKSNQLSAFAANDWLTTGGGLTDDRYSTLKDINTSNVSKLKVAWHIHLGSAKGPQYSAEGNGVVYKGVLYLSTGADDVFAINAATGTVKWKHKAQLEGAAGLLVNRGVALGDGKVFIGQTDGNLVALDQSTGAVVWKRKMGFVQQGYTMTASPQYYNGLVLEGISGGDVGARAFLAAVDATTGDIRWKFYTTPDPGTPGSGTWFGNEWQYGGGAAWHTLTIDPELGLVYWIGGNPVPWNTRGPGANLFTDSIVALHANNGQYAWHYQMIHHDIWDMEPGTPTNLFDVTINGQLRHAIADTGKTGWVYILDRTNGKPLIGIPERKVPQSKFANTWATQPIPVGDHFSRQCTDKSEFRGKVAPDGKPYAIGCLFTPFDTNGFLAFPILGADWAPSSYNPTTHFLYVCSQDNRIAAMEAIPKAKQAETLVLGKSYFGTLVNFSLGKKVTGSLTAMDMTTNKIAWQQKWPTPCLSGSFTTAGGLVFAGHNDGTYTAYDATSGNQLWSSAQLDAGINAPGITYAVDGKQYVLVYVGGTGVLEQTKRGDSVYAFSLP